MPKISAQFKKRPERTGYSSPGLRHELSQTATPWV